MTTLIVTFVCDFTKNVVEVKKGKGKPRKEKKGKGKKTDIPSKQEVEKHEEIKEEELTTVVDVKKPIRFLHIEYNLLPGKLIYKIDVVFWGTVAKVYTKDGIKAMKSINKDGHYWISFSIKHKVVLEENDFVKIKSHVANFSISSNKNKLSFSQAKKEAENTFYFKAEAIELKSDFAEAFNTDPNLNDEPEEIDLRTRNITDVKYILEDLMHFSTKNEPLSDLYIIPEKLQQKKVLSMVGLIATNKKVYGINDMEEPFNVDELLAVKKGKAGKKGKDKKKGKGNKKKGKGDKKKKGKEKKVDTSQILISGETFLIDSMTVFNLKLNNDALQHSFGFMEIENLMTKEQKQNLHPFIVKVNKIVNIPTKILEDHRFSLMYITYDLCGILHTTGARPIAEKVYFVDNHIYFLNEEQLIKLAEIAQNNFLIFKIYGIRVSEPKKSGVMFGENMNDEFISKPLQNNQTEVRKYIEGDREASRKSVLLAIARMNIQDILHPFWRVKRIEQCIHPRYIKYLDENYERFNKVTINTLNIENQDIFVQNPLTENVLITYGMNMHIAVQLLNPIIHILDELIESDVMYNRILIHILNSTIAKSFIFNIFVHNSHWLKRRNIVPNYLIKNYNTLHPLYERNVITGFIFCCIDHCLMFLEGRKKWIYKLFWCAIRREKRHSIKVIYNSNYVHEKRLYRDLLPYGGVYFAPMHCSPYQLLIHNKTFTRGFLPEPVRRALQKFDLIRKCNRLEELPDNLLPTTKELLSLGLEWGVPFHWPVSDRNSIINE